MFNIRSPWDDLGSDPKNHRPSSGPAFNFDNLGFDFSNIPSWLIIGLLIVLWAGSGLYRVKEGERAVVMRFGKYSATTMPGLNYHIPFPFEKVIVENVDSSRRVEIGYRSSGSSVGRRSVASSSVASESIILTGDENILDLTCDVMWHIDSLQEYVFNVMSPEETVRAASQSALREVIGKTPISDILSDKKQQIADDIEKLTQKILNNYKIGVAIENVQLLKAEPPAEVIDSYRDVQTARADRERKVNQAQAYNNDILPRARGEAAKIIEKAKGYKQSKIVKAEGDTKRFLALYKEYSANKQITKDRIYLEMMENILSGRDKVVVSSGSILPHMSVKPQ